MSETKTKLVFKKEIGVVLWPCTISVPKDDGSREEQLLTARFRIVDQSRIDELYRPAGFSTLTASPDGVLLSEALDGFNGFDDENKQPVPDSVSVPWALRIPYVVDGLARGYFEMLGRRTAKN